MTNDPFDTNRPWTPEERADLLDNHKSSAITRVEYLERYETTTRAVEQERDQLLLDNQRLEVVERVAQYGYTTSRRHFNYDLWFGWCRSLFGTRGEEVTVAESVALGVSISEDVRKLERAEPPQTSLRQRAEAAEARRSRAEAVCRVTLPGTKEST